MARRTEQSKPDKTRQEYTPPKWAWAMVRAYLDLSIEQTVSARCKDVGIERSTFYDALKKDEFVVSFTGMLEKALLADSHEVRLAHLKRCIAGDLEAIRLWYEHYGKWTPTTRVLTEPQDEIGYLRDILKGDQRKERIH